MINTEIKGERRKETTIHVYIYTFTNNAIKMNELSTERMRRNKTSTSLLMSEGRAAVPLPVPRSPSLETTLEIIPTVIRSYVCLTQWI